MIVSNITGSNLINLYFGISMLVIMIDMFTAFHAYVEKRSYSYILAFTCIMSAMVQVTYLFSITISSYRVMSAFSSLYFLSVDFSVLGLMTFVRVYSIRTKPQWNDIFKNVIMGYQILDIIFFVINIFFEIMIHYVDDGGMVARYGYEMKPLYYVHLVYNYIMVVLVIYQFLKSAYYIPREYRRPFYLCVLSIILVVGLNALFLYWPNLFGLNHLDYSIWGYSFAAFMIYYLCFRYPKTGMTTFYHSWIVRNINQGVVLFNFEDELIIHNEKVHQIFPEIETWEGLTVKKFSELTNLDINEQRSEEDYSFQHYIIKNRQEFPIRFDHRCLKNDEGTSIGRLFVFTDEKGDTDLLTSFYSWEYFKEDVKNHPSRFNKYFTVAVCDLNGLHDINTRFGKSIGDQAIELLSIAIRKEFTGESYYVRGQEANLIILSFDQTKPQVLEKLERIHNELIRNNELGCLLVIQSSIGIVDNENRDVMEVVQQALKAMRNKKLLDKESRRSELVTSLVKTLSECDPDTEAHVKRTQIMGEELGRRLGLSDMQLSDLALLCILHDIGKIAIPLEILNKPGKLTDSEWRMMKTHTEKGYQIANSSRELSHLADMILHHHERWDGKGYPDRLTKESIPLLSRIISVVDAYDAMVSDRPYRKGMSRQDAITELKNCAGTQFDPGIVNVFVWMLPSIQLQAEAGKAVEETTILPESLLETGVHAGLSTKNVHAVEFGRYIVDEYMQISSVNSNFEKITGYTQEDIKVNNMTQLDLIPVEDRGDYMNLVGQLTNASDVAFLEHRLKIKDGTVIYVFCFGKSYYDSAEKKERTEIIFFNTSDTYSMKMMMNEELTKAELRLGKWEDKYRCDSLTGLLTHEAFKNDIDMKLLEENYKIMFLMMDVDRFKQYNDTYGHSEGDQFLINFAQRLTALIGKQDLACRMGGDEFAAAMFFDKDVTDEKMYEEAGVICEKINIYLSTLKGSTGISMGTAVSDENAKTFKILYENADKALYYAKEHGKGRMCSYNNII